MESLNRVSLRLPATPDSVRVARHAVDGLHWLGDQEEAAFNARLLITELVTNSIRHACLSPSDVVTLEVEPLPGGVRVEVANPGGGFTRPAFGGQPPAGVSGRGI